MPVRILQYIYVYIYTCASIEEDSFCWSCVLFPWWLPLVNSNAMSLLLKFNAVVNVSLVTHLLTNPEKNPTILSHGVLARVYTWAKSACFLSWIFSTDITFCIHAYCIGVFDDYVVLSVLFLYCVLEFAWLHNNTFIDQTRNFTVGPG